jgi:hypothetical protein
VSIIILIVILQLPCKVYCARGARAAALLPNSSIRFSPVCQQSFTSFRRSDCDLRRSQGEALNRGRQFIALTQLLLSTKKQIFCNIQLRDIKRRVQTAKLPNLDFARLALVEDTVARNCRQHKCRDFEAKSTAKTETKGGW